MSENVLAELWWFFALISKFPFACSKDSFLLMTICKSLSAWWFNGGSVCVVRVLMLALRLWSYSYHWLRVLSAYGHVQIIVCVPSCGFVHGHIQITVCVITYGGSLPIAILKSLSVCLNGGSLLMAIWKWLSGWLKGGSILSWLACSCLVAFYDVATVVEDVVWYCGWRHTKT